MAENIILDDGEWKNFLNSAKSKSADFGKYLLAAANLFGFRDIIDHFSKQSGPEGPWPKRKPETDRAYDIMGGVYSSSNNLLVLTGNLRKSFLPGSRYSRRVDRLSVKLFSNPSLEYARIHDEGGEFKAWGKYNATMPQREFMWLSDKAKGLILNMVMNELLNEGPSYGGTV